MLSNKLIKSYSGFLFKSGKYSWGNSKGGSF